MNKSIREAVYKKYDGHCAYCGNYIEYKDMQVDHLVPKRQKHIYKFYNNKSIDSFDNLMPSCRSCNHYKRGHLIDTYRRLLMTIQSRLMDIYIFRVAINYGIVEIKPFNGIFYFESEKALEGK